MVRVSAALYAASRTLVATIALSLRLVLPLSRQRRHSHRSSCCVPGWQVFGSAGGPHLVVAPLAVYQNWANECKQFTPSLTFFKLHGSSAERARLLARSDVCYGEYDVYVTTYDTLKACEDFFTETIPRWSVLVVDEAHHLKNESGGLHRSLARLTCNYRLLLTGTPLQNNLHELWAMLHFLLPDYFTSSATFDEAVDLANQSVDAQRLEHARLLLTNFMLRRTKDIVGLPRKYETLVPCPMAPLQAQWYKRLLASDAASHAVLTVSQLKTLIMQLRKICNHPRTLLAPGSGTSGTSGGSGASSSRAPMGGGGKKGTALREELAALSGAELRGASGKLLVLDRLLDELFVLGSRVLIFSTFTQTLDVVGEFLAHKGVTFSRMDGSTNAIQRELDVRDFNTAGSPTQVFLISTRAGGVGINLASADVVVLYDSDWNPQVDLQAMDRAHRIGQKKPVRVFRLISSDTVEERIRQRAASKRLLDTAIVNATAGGGSAAAAAAAAAAVDDDAEVAADEPEMAPETGPTTLSQDELLQLLGGAALGTKTQLGKRLTASQLRKAVVAAARGAMAATGGGGSDEGAEEMEEEEEEEEEEMEEEEEDDDDDEGEEDEEDEEGEEAEAGAGTKRKRVDESTELAEAVARAAARAVAQAAAVDGEGDGEENDDDAHLKGGRRVLPSRRRAQAQHTNIGHARSGRSKKLQLVHEDFCFMCDGGGDLICCGQCPKVYHLECANLDKVPTGAWHCPWHACAECGRTTSIAGGMLFRCTCCPTAYCFDCSPVDMQRIDVSDEFFNGLLERGWDLTKQRQQKSFFMCGDCASQAEIERRAKAEAARMAEAREKEKERMRREKEEKKRLDEIAKEQRAALQARQLAEKQRLAGIQALMGDTKRMVEALYADGQRRKQELIAKQAEETKTQRERQHKQLADMEAEIQELQRQMAAARRQHTTEAAQMHMDHTTAIATMAADIERQGTTMWEGANLPIHQMPRLKGFSLPTVPKVASSAAMGGLAAWRPDHSGTQAAAQVAAAAAAAAAAGMPMSVMPPVTTMPGTFAGG